MTVTAGHAGGGSSRLALTVRVLTGQSLSQPGTVASSSTAGTTHLPITPQGSGSIIYGGLQVYGFNDLKMPWPGPISC